MVWLPAFEIFNVLCIWLCIGGATDAVRKSALKVDSGRKIPCHTGESTPCQYCTWLFSLTLYWLSHTAHVKSFFFFFSLWFGNSWPWSVVGRLNLVIGGIYTHIHLWERKLQTCGLCVLLVHLTWQTKCDEPDVLRCRASEYIYILFMFQVKINEGINFTLSECHFISVAGVRCKTCRFVHFECRGGTALQVHQVICFAWICRETGRWFPDILSS